MLGEKQLLGMKADLELEVILGVVTGVTWGVSEGVPGIDECCECITTSLTTDSMKKEH